MTNPLIMDLPGAAQLLIRRMLVLSEPTPIELGLKLEKVIVKKSSISGDKRAQRRAEEEMRMEFLRMDEDKKELMGKNPLVKRYDGHKSVTNRKTTTIEDVVTKD
jgi:hypothetical protein